MLQAQLVACTFTVWLQINFIIESCLFFCTDFRRITKTTQKSNTGLAIASLIYNKKEEALPFLLDSVSEWKMNDVAIDRVCKKYESNRKWAKERKKRIDNMKARNTAGQAQFKTKTVGREKAEYGEYVNSTNSEKSKKS